nr:ribonuclease H-like domain-containing protein [Tanacetum cinerariifolium]
MHNDDERVANDLNKGKSDSSSSFMSGSNLNIVDFPIDSGNDADSSDGLVATQNEEEIVELPGGRKAIGSKWIYKIKFKSSGEIDRYKARLVAQVFGQKESIDYEETFSPVVKMAPRQGNAKLTSTLIENGFGQSIYINQTKYVLDFLSEYGMLACKPVKTPLMSKLVISNEASENDPLLENVTYYQILMGKLIYLTNTTPDSSYVVHCLRDWERRGARALNNPRTATGEEFLERLLSLFSDLDQDGRGSKAFVKLRSKVFRRETPLRRLWYIVTAGYCVFLNNSFVSWKSKKQNTFSKSSTDVEYKALASVTSEVTWILNFLKDLQIENILPVSLHCDSNSTIKIVANPVFHERTKHLEIDLHFVREKILNGVVKTVKVDSEHQIADILTKGLDTI